MKIAFEPRTFKPETQALIDAANDLLDTEYSGMRITLRQLWYRFVGLKLIPDSWVDPVYNAKIGLPPDTKNTPRNYKRLGKIVSDARLAGMIDWDAIEDRGRRPTIWRENASIKDAVTEAIEAFRLPRWKGQSRYVELWCEKDALASFLEPIAAAYHVPILINKGYSSSSAVNDSAQRIADACGRLGRWLGDDGNVPGRVLYVGDHDPSGEDMVRDLQARLDLHLTQFDDIPEVSVSKIALTIDQVRAYDLPPDPAKTSDCRAAGYIAKFGNQSWEVDALEPRVLQRIVRAALDAEIDRPRMEEVKAEEKRQRKAVETAVEAALAGGDE